MEWYSYRQKRLKLYLRWHKRGRKHEFNNVIYEYSDSEDDYNIEGRAIQKILEEIINSITWKQMPNLKERDLRVIIYLIVKEYIRDKWDENDVTEGEEYILNKIKGRPIVKRSGNIRKRTENKTEENKREILESTHIEQMDEGEVIIEEIETKIKASVEEWRTLIQLGFLIEDINDEDFIKKFREIKNEEEIKPTI
ncbi:hypothetical protein RCL_jg21704.t1 [Rhizophagus clarus]|uniref:Uncharacterized protein n=1 Tax=Rhizophagus clarus TaxID=94130 RepID=A0A8H3KZB0_9GLOM|nr:hypothetical protein RCL_jg21704.t1 [Rhizophagus clarus]